MQPIRRLLTYYSPLMPHRFVYMFQQVEYVPRTYLEWVLKHPDLLKLIKRGKLVKTSKAVALLSFVYVLYFLLVLSSFYLLAQSEWVLAALLMVLIPPAISLALVVGVWTGSIALYIFRKRLIRLAEAKLKNNDAIKIAVLGSYGKTTMKELLQTVLAEAKKVRSTPGNMNVPISHARWITKRIDGDEEVLIFEYGEGSPGDIAKFGRMTQPDWAIITGIAPNHLNNYGSIEALAADLMSIRKFLADSQIRLNAEAEKLVKLAPDVPTYSARGTLDWEVENIKVGLDGTSFEMKNESAHIKLHSQLLGKHQVGPLVAVASIAYSLGLTKEQIQTGIAKTKPYEHRMSVRNLHGAWLVDDTYNGNLEGIRAGLALLEDLPAKRKTYVTPGLVDQGSETERVHKEIGELIGRAHPNIVVLMQNSVTKYIQAGLDKVGYKGKLQIQDDPLEFYSNLDQFVASGDLVVMQNDWTDNYS